MENMRNVKLPPGNAATRLVSTVLFGGAALYGLSHSLFNVEGGHRAIVFNRVGGIKDKVSDIGLRSVFMLWIYVISLWLTEA